MQRKYSLANVVVAGALATVGSLVAPTSAHAAYNDLTQLDRNYLSMPEFARAKEFCERNGYKGGYNACHVSSFIEESREELPVAERMKHATKVMTPDKNCSRGGGDQTYATSEGYMVSKTLTEGGSRSVTATINYGIATKGGFTGGGSLAVSVEKNWSTSYGYTYTKNQTRSITVKPGYEGWLQWEPNVARVHGIVWVTIGVNHEAFKPGMYAFPVDFEGDVPFLNSPEGNTGNFVYRDKVADCGPNFVV
ncbi:hypothetical protein [Streptomyces sp. NPDC051776]|uniref:hypothetical protein n=1 Tax=Streptomyces sp. NPDC051776 TaxID=3155414 RepID=UPI0034470C0E